MLGYNKDAKFKLNFILQLNLIGIFIDVSIFLVKIFLVRVKI